MFLVWDVSVWCVWFVFVDLSCLWVCLCVCVMCICVGGWCAFVWVGDVLLCACVSCIYVCVCVLYVCLCDMWYMYVCVTCLVLCVMCVFVCVCEWCTRFLLAFKARNMKVCILVHSYCKLSCRELSRIVMLTAYQELSGIVITSTLLVVVLGWRWNSCSPRFVLLLSFVHQFGLLLLL